MLKRLIRRPFVQAAGAWIVWRYLSFVYATTRWQLVGAEHLATILAQSPNAITAFWHERLPLMPMQWRLARQSEPRLRGTRAHVLVSQHNDGRFIGDVVRRFDLRRGPGSSSKGGAMAVIALIRSLDRGDVVAITPDGPRGPRRRAAPGVAQLALASRLPVIAAGAATTRHIRLKSWDRMMLPLPFGRGVVVLQPPITPDRADPEGTLAAIEAAMTLACDTADQLLGIELVA